MNLILLGANAMACFTISLFFTRFWVRTADRFFLFFALAFIIEGIGRLMLGLVPFQTQHEPLFYILRLVAFALILVAIIDKNRKTPKA